MDRIFKISILTLFLFLAKYSFSQVTLPAFFSDNMILQQNQEVSIWGMDSGNSSIEISGSWGQRANTVSNQEGKWKLKIQTPSYGGPYTLSIKGSNEITLSNVMIGEVWLASGQSNMEMPVKGFANQPINGSAEAILTSKNKNIRLFTVKKKASLEPLDDVEGVWAEASPSSVKDFSATAYFFGKRINEITDIPIGLIHTSWSGSSVEPWIDMESFAEFPNINLPSELPERGANQTPTLLYNAMIHPLIGYGIKGAIWYQGESNRGRADEYSRLFPKMIELWREKWNQGSFPFYFAQLAPYGYRDGSMGFIRESQTKTMLNTENTGMAVTLDIGECASIHPMEKKTVGDRLAYWALVKDYGLEGIVYSGPIYKEILEVKEGKIKVSFDFAGNGLTSYGKELASFEIAGDDKVFHPAKAQIGWDRNLTVWADGISNPVAVRYAWGNCDEGTLFNTEGLPASSFRTDSWDEE